MKTSNENIRLLKPFFRGLPIIAGVIFIALMIAKRYLLYATPLYESTARIRLADTKDGMPSTNLYKDFDVFTSATKIGGELEVIKSKVIINKTLDSLDFDVTMYRVGQMRKVELYHQSPVFIAYTITNEKWYNKVFAITINKDNSLSISVPGEKTRRQTVLGKSILLEGAEIRILKNDSLLKKRTGLSLADNYEFIIHSRQYLADFVLANLDISAVDKEVPVLRLNFKSPVPEKAANLINKLAQTYVNDYVETKCKAANTTVEFLNEQLQEVGGKLSASENAIASYRDAKNIINIRQETETDLRKIADMKVQQTNVKMNLEAIQNLEKYMAKGRDNVLELAPNFEAYTDLLATELVKKMKQLQAEKKDLLTKYTPEYEEVKNIDAKLKDISTYLEEGIRNTRKSLETKYSRISGDIDDAEKVFVGLPGKEKTMGILTRNFSLNEETYNFLHGKRTEAQIARAATISFHRIISTGDIPKSPVSPNGTLIKVLAIFLGFLSAVAIIYMVHALKGKVNDNTTIEKKSGIPVAANTPMLGKEQAIRSYFHKLAIQLEIKDLLPVNGVIAFSSFGKNEGKSFTTWNLAKELAAQNKKVLLADADSGLHTNNRAKDIINVKYVNLAGTEGIYTNSETLKHQVETWKKEYDHIIIKNEPINNASNGLLLMKIADANLFLLDSRKTSAKMITEADLLQEEYLFPKMEFLLNRAGYNPNIISQVINAAKAIYLKLVKKK